jgi:hypothetical protein
MSCGFGSGPDNITIFSYGVYFQIGSSWYQLVADTDKAVQPYHGPGTYAARATLGPISSNGPQYAGSVQITVSRDQAPDGGTLTGTITAQAGQGVIKIRGGWTCSQGPELGPA